MAGKKNREKYICSSCENSFVRWAGRCPDCGEWNTLEEMSEANAPGAVASVLQRLSEIELDSCVRTTTGNPELDLLLGGGLVPGSFILIGGEPGVGKSTLILDIARRLPGKILYFTGEESAAQIRMRAERMGVHNDELYVSNETELGSVCNTIATERPALAVIDSIQTMNRSGGSSAGGAPALIREATLQLLSVCKGERIPLLVTGHITKDGAIAGPRLMEHMVDVVLYFESDRLNHFRILRGVKNRFGTTGEVALFEMGPTGLKASGSNQVLGALNQSVSPGRIYSAMVEGSRALGVEVQALVSRSYGAQTRRMAEGLDSRRLVLIAAVLEKFLKINLSECDVFANLAGGLSADEPALDLALAAAILSSYRELAVGSGAAFIGEVGLSGEVRPVSCILNRIKELTNLGFTNFYVPEGNCAELSTEEIQLHSVGHVTELSSAALKGVEKSA